MGIVDGEILLDLNYEEDSRADVDMNLVMTAGYKVVELQATAERQVFDENQLGKMIGLARQGVQSLIAKQQAILGMLTLRQSGIHSLLGGITFNFGAPPVPHLGARLVSQPVT